MVCSNCGYVLGPDDPYCGGCGAFLTDAPEAEAGADHPVAAVPGDPDPVDPLRDTAPHDTPWGIPYAPAVPPAPARSTPSAGMIAAAVAALALVALLLFWVLRPEGEESVGSGGATTGPSATADATSDGAGTATDTPTRVRRRPAGPWLLAVVRSDPCWTDPQVRRRRRGASSSRRRGVPALEPRSDRNGRRLPRLAPRSGIQTRFRQ